MFPSGVIWTKSFQLFEHQRGRKPSRLVLWGSCRGRFCFLNPPVLFFYCANTFLLHRQAGMLTHKPCKELKLARADGKKERVLLKVSTKKTSNSSLNKKNVKPN